jgi:hypothetical protein
MHQPSNIKLYFSFDEAAHQVEAIPVWLQIDELGF